MSYSNESKAYFCDQIANALANLKRLVKDHDGHIIFAIKVDDLDFIRVGGDGNSIEMFHLLGQLNADMHKAYNDKVNDDYEIDNPDNNS